MELIESVPCIRFADLLTFQNRRAPSRTYDSRLFYTVKGEAKLQAGGRDLILRRGALILFQPGTPYSFVPDPEITMAVFDFDFTQDHAGQTGFLVPCPTALFEEKKAHAHVDFSDAPSFSEPLFLENAAFLEPKLREIVQEFRQKRLFFRGKSSALFKEVLFDLARTVEAGSDARDVMTRLFLYVEEHLDEPITNRTIGRALYYNPNYLNRLMRRQTGMSLHQYVLQKRLNQATRLLVTTQTPISEIAAGLGFHSAAHFSNFFKKATGTTPARCRKNGAV